MRFGIRVALTFLVCSAGVAAAAEDNGKKSPGAALKMASASGTEAGDARSESNAQAVTLPAKAARSNSRQSKAATLIARIDLTSQRMHVTANGKTVGDWAISSGKYDHETPRGSFRPKWSSKMHYSRKYDNSPMPYSVFFNGGIATHGTAYTGRLGTPASHGCVRLRTANAKRFYHLVHQHGYNRTRIIVTGRADVTRTASRSRNRSRSTSNRRNSFSASSKQWGSNPYWSYGPQRRSVQSYDRARIARHRERVRRYYQSRRMVYPGDRY